MMPKTTDTLNPNRIPSHVAIIMDGNGRWAMSRSEDRSIGHAYGVETVRTVLRTASEVGVKYLTLYTFSEENWRRPAEEVQALMSLLVQSIYKEVDELDRMNVRLRFMGEADRLPLSAQEAMSDGVKRTETNDGIQLILAVNYSAKTEILRAARLAMPQVEAGMMLDEETLRQYFYLPDVPDPDLLIRTGGECRISNFLLWQSAYSELYFTETLWPDFSADDFKAALLDFQSRERRFGMTGAQIQNSSK